MIRPDDPTPDPSRAVATEPAEDWLDAALATAGRGHRADYLDDGGFTTRVMAALPLPAAPPAWRRPAVALLWAAAGIGGALALPGAFTDVAREFFRIVGGQPVSLPGIAVAVALAGAATWSAAAYLLHSD
jgi:di/tricarboxylate transporter